MWVLLLWKFNIGATIKLGWVHTLTQNTRYERSCLIQPRYRGIPERCTSNTLHYQIVENVKKWLLGGLTPFWHAVYLSNRYLGFWVSSLFSWPGIWTIGYLVIRTTGKSEYSVSGNLENCEFSLAHITRFTLLQWNEHSLVAPVLFWNEQSLVEKPDQLAVHFFSAPGWSLHCNFT